MTALSNAVCLLDMSIMAAKHVLADGKAPLQRRLAWLGAELERLAGEAYRLADEAGDDPGASPLVIGVAAMGAVPMRDIAGMDHDTLRTTHPELYEDPCREPIPGFPPKE